MIGCEEVVMSVVPGSGVFLAMCRIFQWLYNELDRLIVPETCEVAVAFLDNELSSYSRRQWRPIYSAI